ncbi:hypothetical protein D6T69_08045 [Tenacibaculum singaporense]|uniref:Uncharacterized protein n=1 Tax=Tenacibaculum singaporense TaxID=2358479 RepID=A0A3Q8RRQ5_9FLAO|nr:hypothetical protein [Tenacibaculum singaporense]AZJ35475.1 hypothetical protein D6T69_08045 [Tenacibaculum singaporense]
MKVIKNILTVIIVLTSISLSAQELKHVDKSIISVNDLPEYVVITSENTKLLGGINITIDSKKSDYQNILEELETLLQNRKKLKIRNQTDLLNALSKLGFEYVDAYNATAGTLGVGGGDDIDIFGSEAKYRINMVFRKKTSFRN